MAAPPVAAQALAGTLRLHRHPREPDPKLQGLRADVINQSLDADCAGTANLLWTQVPVQPHALFSVGAFGGPMPYPKVVCGYSRWFY